MRYLILPIFILLLSGCTDTPAPQDEKEIQAKSAIEENMAEAHRAQAEYVALQRKRQREGTL